MFTGSPTYVRFRSYAARMPSGIGGFGWLILAPGLGLILLALSILIWPQLLAYLVASALLCLGVALTAWGWSVVRAERRRARSAHAEDTVYYRVL